jgi:predicted flap endonuclease-1-like 5' DNA nuclease
VAVPTARAATPKPAAALPQTEQRSPESDRAADPGAGIAKLRMELDDASRAAAAREADLRTTLSQREARVRELEAAAAEQGARIEKAEAVARGQVSAGDARIKELEALLAARDQRIEKLEQNNKALLANQGEPGDDLKMIRGIGPAFERELRRLGVVTFAQIAAWTPEDIDAIGPKIKAKPERIRRENWIESATELAKRSSNPT